MRKILLVALMILFIPICFASQTIELNETTPLVYQFVLAGQLTNVTSVVVTVSNITDGQEFIQREPAFQLTNESGSFVDGVYYYNITPNQTGNYLVVWESIFDGNVYQASDDILVVENLQTIAKDTEWQVEEVFSTFILFLVGLSIAAMGRYIEEPVFYIFSGVYYIGSSAYLGFTNQGWTFPMFFALFGLILIWKGISDYLAATENDRNKNEFDDYE